MFCKRIEKSHVTVNVTGEGKMSLLKPHTQHQTRYSYHYFYIQVYGLITTVFHNMNEYETNNIKFNGVWTWNVYTTSPQILAPEMWADVLTL